MHKATWAILAAGILLSMTSQALARGALIEWWQNEAITKKLVITEEQKNKIIKVMSDLQKKREDGLKTYRESRVQLNHHLGKFVIDDKTIVIELDKMIGAVSAVQREIVVAKIKVHHILTLKQRKVMLAEYPDAFNSQTRWLKPASWNQRKRKG